MYDPMFKRADSVDDAVNAILKFEQEDMTRPIEKLVNKLHKNYFSANTLINKLKEYDGRQ